MIRLGWNRARGLLASELQRLFQLSYGSLLHWDLFTGEALTGLEAERSVSGISCSQKKALAGLEAERSVSGISCPQKRRSPGWRRKDPSRGFLVPRRGAHRVGGGKIRLSANPCCAWIYSQERRSPGLVRRGAHRVGGGKHRLSTMTRLGPGYIFYSQERRSPGWRWKDLSWTWE